MGSIRFFEFLEDLNKEEVKCLYFYFEMKGKNLSEKSGVHIVSIRELKRGKLT